MGKIFYGKYADASAEVSSNVKLNFEADHATNIFTGVKASATGGLDSSYSFSLSSEMKYNIFSMKPWKFDLLGDFSFDLSSVSYSQNFTVNGDKGFTNLVLKNEVIKAPAVALIAGFAKYGASTTATEGTLSAEYKRPIKMVYESVKGWFKMVCGDEDTGVLEIKNSSVNFHIKKQPKLEISVGNNKITSSNSEATISNSNAEITMNSNEIKLNDNSLKLSSAEIKVGSYLNVKSAEVRCNNNTISMKCIDLTSFQLK